MSFLDSVLGLADKLRAPQTVSAHCDIPCGIYDPHQAQIAALTVIRMMQLMDGLNFPGGGDKNEVATYAMQMSRYTEVKEEHAALCEHELTVIYTDYFKPEHAQKYSNLHDLYWQTAKLTSTVKQTHDMNTAQQLLSNVQQFAEMFWDSKGVKTRRGPSNQTVGGEMVYVAG
jgi:nickel superoxide dismutase